MLPVTAAGYQQRIGQLQNYVTPQQQQLYSQQVSQLTGLELPLAQTLVNLGITNSSQVAQLQAALAGKTLSEQVQLFAQLGVPIAVAQQLAQSLPGAVGQLSSTNLSNNMYGLAQDYQNPIPGGLPVYPSAMPNATPGQRNSNAGQGGLPNAGNVQSGQTPLNGAAVPGSALNPISQSGYGTGYYPTQPNQTQLQYPQQCDINGMPISNANALAETNLAGQIPSYDVMSPYTSDLGTISSYQ